MKVARTFAVLTFALLAMSISLPAHAATHTVPDKKGAIGVTQYHTTVYSKSTCGGSTVYRFESVSFRYHRKSTRNSAKIKLFSMGQHGGQSCNGTPHTVGQRRVVTTDKAVCFGCRSTSKYWSNQYYYDPNWSYMTWGSEAYQGSMLRTNVRYVNSSGTVSGRRICTAYAMQGGALC